MMLTRSSERIFNPSRYTGFKGQFFTDVIWATADIYIYGYYNLLLLIIALLELSIEGEVAIAGTADLKGSTVQRISNCFQECIRVSYDRALQIFLWLSIRAKKEWFLQNYHYNSICMYASEVSYKFSVYILENKLYFFV